MTFNYLCWRLVCIEAMANLASVQFNTWHSIFTEELLQRWYGIGMHWGQSCYMDWLANLEALFRCMALGQWFRNTVISWTYWPRSDRESSSKPIQWPGIATPSNSLCCYLYSAVRLFYLSCPEWMFPLICSIVTTPSLVGSFVKDFVHWSSLDGSVKKGISNRTARHGGHGFEEDVPRSLVRTLYYCCKLNSYWYLCRSTVYQWISVSENLCLAILTLRILSNIFVEEWTLQKYLHVW